MFLRFVLAVLAASPALAPVQQAIDHPWEQLKAVYDVQAVGEVKETDRQAAEGTYTEFSFASDNASTAYGTFVRPNGKGPFPCVVLLHGLGGSRADMLAKFGKDFLKRNVAVMALDAPHHGQRATDEDRKAFQALVMAFITSKDREQGLGASMVGNDFKNPHANLGREAIVQGVRDIRRALDWVKKPEHRVDSGRIGAMGISLGSIMASILSGVDPRINANLLVIGGDPVVTLLSKIPAGQGLEAGPAAAPSLYLGHSTAHVLMLNGYNDTVIPRAATERLFASAPGATLVFYDTPGDMANFFGHSIPSEGYALGIDWLVRMLGVPKPAARAPLKPGL